MFTTLLLDDEQGPQPLMERYLNSFSHCVTRTRSVLGALTWFDRARFDFLVIHLPHVGQIIKALALCRVLRSDPKTAAIRILLISDASGMQDKAKTGGVDELLTNPYTQEDVRAAVERLSLHGKRLHPPFMLGMTVHQTMEAHSRGLLGWLRGPA